MRSEPAYPLLDGRFRRWTALLLAGCAVVLVALGVLVALQSRVDGLDRAIDSWVLRSVNGRDGLLNWVAALATLGPAGGTSLIMLVVCLVTGRLKGAILAATAVPVASVLCDSLVKPLVHRGDFAYPSGHVTSVLALAAMLTVLLILPPHPLVRGRRARLLVPAVGVLAGCGVAVAVIGLRWHFFTDTIGGAALGTGTVCALALLLDRPVVSRWLRTPTDWLQSRAPALRPRPPPPRPGSRREPRGYPGKAKAARACLPGHPEPDTTPGVRYDNREGHPRRGLFLGHAGPDPQAPRRDLDQGRLHRRRRGERHLSQPRGPRRGHRDHL